MRRVSVTVEIVLDCFDGYTGTMDVVDLLSALGDVQAVRIVKPLADMLPCSICGRLCVADAACPHTAFDYVNLLTNEEQFEGNTCR